VFVDEVRRSGGPGEARSPLEDPELRALRSDDEPLLGSGAMAVTDSLTMLYSHRYLQDAAAAEAQRAALQGRGFSVIVGELTELDEVNATQGFAAGDRLLRAAAGAFERAAAGAPGTVAARLSGRQLALLVPDDGDEAERRLGCELAGGPAARLGRSSWREGDTGAAVVRRARLSARTGPPPANVEAALARTAAPAPVGARSGQSVWRRWRAARS
jgi:GGDEF domain-containing protein